MSKEAVLNELNSQVGSLIHQSEWIDISQEKIDAFADATEDHQWIHIDPAKAAEESPFKATIAHGYFTLSLYPKLRGLVDPSTPVFRDKTSSIMVSINLFSGPVISGSSIRANCTLVSVEEIKGSIELVEEYSVEVKDQDRPACVAECIMRLYF